MVKYMLIILLSLGVFVEAQEGVRYINGKTDGIYWDVLPTIKSLNNKRTYGYSGISRGIDYILSAESGNNFCWVKQIDSVGNFEIIKVFIDWRNTEYKPETYYREYNEWCKTHKTTRKINTDSIVRKRLSLVYDFLDNYKQYVEVSAPENFNWMVYSYDDVGEITVVARESWKYFYMNKDQEEYKYHLSEEFDIIKYNGPSNIIGNVIEYEKLTFTYEKNIIIDTYEIQKSAICDESKFGGNEFGFFRTLNQQKRINLNCEGE